MHMGIEVGFKHLMVIEKEKGMKKINNSNLEIARQDHTAIFKINLNENYNFYIKSTKTSLSY